MNAVTTSIRPVPLPMSAMAIVTSPTMMRGMEKFRNSLKMALNVTNSRTSEAGRKFPKSIPKIMAMMMRGNNPMWKFFMSIGFLSG